MEQKEVKAQKPQGGGAVNAEEMRKANIVNKVQEIFKVPTKPRGGAPAFVSPERIKEHTMQKTEGLKDILGRGKQLLTGSKYRELGKLIESGKPGWLSAPADRRAELAKILATYAGLGTAGAATAAGGAYGVKKMREKEAQEKALLKEALEKIAR